MCRVEGGMQMGKCMFPKYKDVSLIPRILTLGSVRFKMHSWSSSTARWRHEYTGLADQSAL